MTIPGGRFTLGQRVFVQLEAQHGRVVCDRGRVIRLRRADNFAWVVLDRRSSNPDVHPFPLDDPQGRACHVIAHPDDCDVLV